MPVSSPKRGSLTYLSGLLSVRLEPHSEGNKKVEASVSGLVQLRTGLH